MSQEPSVIVGFLTALAAAVLVFLRSFGVDISSDQQDSIRALIAILAPAIAALIIRGFVWAPDSVKDVVADAHAAGATGQPAPRV